jgi:hypothetical protein
MHVPDTHVPDVHWESRPHGVPDGTRHVPPPALVHSDPAFWLQQSSSVIPPEPSLQLPPAGAQQSCPWQH